MDSINILIFDLFAIKYPEIEIPNKVLNKEPVLRPVDTYFATWIR